MNPVDGILLLYGSLALLALAAVGTVLVVVFRKRRAPRDVFHANPIVPAPYVPSYDERFAPDLTPTAPASRTCDHCGRPVPAEYAFCADCGAASCPACHRFSPPGAGFCGFCGASLHA